MHTLRENCNEFGITLYDMLSPQQGIVHVIGPELGLTLPGMTIVCGDSHTSTHGAFGAFALGIGTSDVEHVLATQCLWMHKPKSLNIKFSKFLVEAARVSGDVGFKALARDAYVSGVHNADLDRSFRNEDGTPGPSLTNITENAGKRWTQYGRVRPSLAELIGRVEKTVAWLKTVEAQQLDGSEEKSVTVKRPTGDVQMKGLELLLNRSMPNFMFHCTTAYDIMRHNGVELGKRDFMGAS